MTITQNLINLKNKLPNNVTLVAVSKTKNIAQILEAYQARQRIFAENYVQELVEKQKVLPKDIEWHFIGHLQWRKVKLIAPFVSLIQGVDSLKLLKEINKEAKKNNRIINCLLQIYIAKEESKFGLNEDEIKDLIEYINLNHRELNNVKILGFMGMATFTNNQNQIKNEFIYLKNIFDNYKRKNIENCNLEILSMGMSADYKIAIDCGSTMIRIGSNIFGER